MAATLGPAQGADSDLDRSVVEDEPRGTDGDEENSQQTGATNAPQSRLAKLPLARIKALMKADPDVTLASQESVFIIAKATVCKLTLISIIAC